MGYVWSEICHGLPISVFLVKIDSKLNWKFRIQIWITRFKILGFTWFITDKVIFQKPANSLSAQNSEMFIVLGRCNFGFLTKERDLRPNHLEQYWPYWKWRQQTVCYVSLKLADRPKRSQSSIWNRIWLLENLVLFVEAWLDAWVMSIQNRGSKQYVMFLWIHR